METMSPALAKPGVGSRIAALLGYAVVLILPLLVLLFGRKHRFVLFHACQSLSITLVALVVPLLWFVSGWLFTFFSVQVPLLYIIPIGLILLLPVWQRRSKAVRYSEQGSWFGIALTLIVAIALIYMSWLALRFLANIILPLGGPLMLMSGFSIVIAAYIAIMVAWIAGVINALAGRWKPVPLLGGWGERLYDRLTAPPVSLPVAPPIATPTGPSPS
ncbi:MAG: hypothetical protein KIT87_12360 [Anaerolineae bacterium]|nr:hypothetical protein [Anaerolineae bacterium]